MLVILALMDTNKNRRQFVNIILANIIHCATGGSMVSKGQFGGLDWNRITRLHSQVMTGTLLKQFRTVQ